MHLLYTSQIALLSCKNTGTSHHVAWIAMIICHVFSSQLLSDNLWILAELTCNSKISYIMIGRILGTQPGGVSQPFTACVLAGSWYFHSPKSCLRNSSLLMPHSQCSGGWCVWHASMVQAVSSLDCTPGTFQLHVCHSLS